MSTGTQTPAERRASFWERMREPVSPRTNLILAGTTATFGIAFLAALFMWLALSGSPAAGGIAALIVVGVTAGIAVSLAVFTRGEQ